jgi:hypothetical protein
MPANNRIRINAQLTGRAELYKGMSIHFKHPETGGVFYKTILIIHHEQAWIAALNPLITLCKVGYQSTMGNWKIPTNVINLDVDFTP